MTIINPIPIINSNTGLSASGPITLLTAGPDTGQNDLVPAVHLSRWARPDVKVIEIIGDSTGTDAVAANYSLDPTQTIWGALKAEIVRRNPQLRFGFINRAIASTNWANPVQTANDRSPVAPVPDWYVNRDKIWLDYVRDDQPDTLFIVMGTNAPSSGQTAGSSVASFINDTFIMINGWVKVPDIVLITTKIGNPAAGPPFSTDQENYKGMMSFLRTFARSNRNGYTAFPRIPPIGLIDLGRQYAARALGKDLAHQYMSKVASAVHNGYTLVGPYPGTVTVIGTTTDGDLRMTLVFRGAGGTALYNAIGATGFFIACSAFISNRIHVTLTNTGTWVTRYQFIGTDSAPVIIGNNYSPPVGDVTMTISLKGETCRILLNDTYVIDGPAARLIQNCTVSIGTGVTPTGSITFDVTEFLEGIGAPVLQTLDPTTAFGGGSLVAGNDINHLSSTSVALIDYQTIAASNLAAPPMTAAQLDEESQMRTIYSDLTSTPSTGVAIGTEEVLKTANIQPGQLFNIGDALEWEAWGSLLGTTDNKTVRARLNGIAGLVMIAPTTSSATALRWRASGTVAKSASNVQLSTAHSSISVTTTSATSGQAGNVDTSAMTMVITSSNGTNIAAGSITCDGFRIKYSKAPGT